MAEPDCIFCRIVDGSIPSNRVAEDDVVVAIRDIAPQAPTHVLVIPRRHVGRASELGRGDGQLLGAVFEAIASVARREGIAEDGYRVVVNEGDMGGQTVDHVHFHVLGGRRMTWPPG